MKSLFTNINKSSVNRFLRCKNGWIGFKYNLKFKSAVASTVPDQGAPPDESAQTVQIPFVASSRGSFFQAAPVLRNQFNEDVTLQSYLQRTVPKQVYSEIETDLEQFGDKVATNIYELGLQCEREPPQLQQYDAWGNRIDKIITSLAWKKMHDISAEEGLIAIPYECRFGEYSRLYQMSKLFMFSPSSGLYSCPLAMTDAAAKTIQVIGKEGHLSSAFKHLTSRDARSFWTSGQWMTERRGGSDVANGTETMAVAQPDGSYKLYGYKWFSSATDSDMTFTLARIVDDNGQVIKGTNGLSMFYMETRDEAGKLNNIEVHKLKDKLGTRQLPTAELLLCGSKAYLASAEGRGVPAISSMLTITRIHNSISSAAAMRRIINMARDYSTRRQAFGKTIKDYPLHIKNLANMEVEARAAFLLVMDLGRLLGLEECNKSNERNKQLLRLLTPVTKLVTAKQAVAVASEGLECFGGQGYIEETGIPGILRDAQVLPIWEGTTNILSLDVLRSIVKSQGNVLNAFYANVHEKMAAVSSPDLSESAERVIQSATFIIQFATEYTSSLEVAAREFAFSIGYTYMGALMIEHANRPDATQQDIYAAKRWCERDLIAMMTQQFAGNYDNSSLELETNLVMDAFTGTES